jgi:putative colanic acid biosynthesis acetyltransferase WcaF
MKSLLPRLKDFTNLYFLRGRPRIVEALWLLAQWALVASWIPGTTHRRWLLRVFGAKIGEGVQIKPGVRVKFPWRLEVGDHSWLGEDVWIDNLDKVSIGANCCISQGAYLCTGSHDWSRSTFDLITGPIRINDGAWIAARSSIGPGVTVGEGAVLCLGSVANKDLQPWSIYLGVPAVYLRTRVITTDGATESRSRSN